MNVAVIGASKNSERYSYQAVVLLAEKGHTVFPVHPSCGEVAGINVFAGLDSVGEKIDTVTLYVSAKHQDGLDKAILQSGARRVIFNPGAENPELQRSLAAAGLEVVEGCTLVMLRTGQF